MRFRLLLAFVGSFLCCAGSHAAPWKFAVLGDGRTGGENNNTTGVHDPVNRAIAEALVRDQVDLIVFSGDLANGGVRYGPMKQQFANFKASWAPVFAAKIPFYVVRGNHDTAAAQDNPKGTSLAAWREAFPDLPQNGPAGEEGLTYRVDHANARFIAVDQFIGKKPGFDAKVYDSKVNRGMINPWAIEQVKAATSRWVFVFGHEAAFIGNHKDCLANVPDERDDLFEALADKGGVYLAGHDHMYVRQTAPDRKGRDVLTLVVGDAGAPAQVYGNTSLNGQVGSKVMPKTHFVNAKPFAAPPTDEELANAAKAAKEGKAPPAPPLGPPVPNTDGHPMYFGYVIVTVDGDKLTGEWRALVNYDSRTSKWTDATGKAKFETLDRFAWPAK